MFLEGTDKKILRAIKWLERCVSACRAGSSESALMDIECARVDLDRAREDIWQTNGKKYAPKSSAWEGGKVAFAAALFLLFTAAPISIVEPISFYLEWVTPDEKMLLANLRLRFADANEASVEDVSPEPARPVARIYQRPVIAKQTTNIIDEAKVYSLVKTGERALRNDQIVVKVEGR